MVRRVGPARPRMVRAVPELGRVVWRARINPRARISLATRTTTCRAQAFAESKRTRRARVGTDTGNVAALSDHISSSWPRIVHPLQYTHLYYRRSI
jgi:hypothetical protein